MTTQPGGKEPTPHECKAGVSCFDVNADAAPEAWGEELKSGCAWFCISDDAMDWLKIFIRRVGTSLPYDVTFWKNEGIKRGYWDFFEKKAIAEYRKELLSHLPAEWEQPTVHGAGYNEGIREARSLIEKV